jgi:hypothetical protein
MIDPFDIFKVEQHGSVRWVRAIADLQRAKSYILKVLSIATAADYIILNQLLPNSDRPGYNLRRNGRPDSPKIPSPISICFAEIRATQMAASFCAM